MWPQVQSMDYGCVVFDTAPTGHTLRLLQLPAMMDKALGKLVSMRGMMGGMLGQVRILKSQDFPSLSSL